MPPPPIVPKPKPATVWLTRDSDEAGPHQIVKVWLQRPTRIPWGEGFFWVCDDPKALWSCYSLVDAQRFYGTIPDYAEMLIRNGN